MKANLTFEQINNSNVILRCDFNEPVKNNILLSTKRIDANILVLQELIARKNNVILLSHHSDKGQTLSPVYEYLKKIFEDVYYLNNTNTNVVLGYFISHRKEMSLPKIILVENTRLFFECQGGASNIFSAAKNLDEANDLDFAKFLSSLGDYFVYDAFSVGHRDHSSTVGVAKILPSCFGPTFLKEYNNLKKLSDESDSTLVVMGGAKLSTKLPIIEKFLNAGSIVCVGGAMVHPILKAKGVDIKNSFTEEGITLSDSVSNNKNIILPKELIWNTDDKENPNTKIIDDIFDVDYLKNIIREKNIKNILWNGPVGMYESGSTKGTDIIKNFLEDMRVNNINTVVGGGDTLTYLESYPDFHASYISLSGGAMLTFLSDGTLPVLKAVKI